MKRKNLLRNVKRELEGLVEVEYKKGAENFFKENVVMIGVRLPNRRKVAKKYFGVVKNWSKGKIFEISEELMELQIDEYRTIVFEWVFRIKDRFEKKDFERWEKWIRKYVSNWGACDDFCTHTVGYFLARFPQFLPRLKMWAKGKNRWFRRASAVSLIYPVRREKKYLNEVFEIADILLTDFDDLVQKGYGWMLKEASNVYAKKVMDFVIKRKDKMPRTALRYAIEKMPESWKKKAMEK